MNSRFSKHLFIPIIIAILLVCGCASASKQASTATTDGIPIELDFAKVSQTLLEANLFQDELATVENSYSEMLLGIAPSEYKDALIYMGSGATAERLVLLESSDKETTQSLYEKLDAHVKEQLTAYADYMPKEVEKLEHAVLVSKDNYVILCIANGYEEAAELIKELL